MTPWLKTKLEQSLLVIRMVWFALMASQGAFAVVQFYRPLTGGNSGFELNPMTAILGGVALVLIMVSRLIPGWLLSNARMEKLRREPVTAEHLRTLITPKGLRLYSDAEIEEMVRLPLPELQLCRALGPYSTAKIFQWAMCEAAGLLGFQLAIAHQRPMEFVAFAALALLGMLTTPPSLDELQRSASRR